MSRRWVISEYCTTCSATWRDEEHPAVSAQHHVPGQNRSLPDANRSVDADHGGIQARAGGQHAEMVRRIVEADERREILQLLQAVDIAHRSLVDDSIVALRVNGVTDIIADRRPVLLQVEVIADVNVARLQHVHGPGIRTSEERREGID